MWKRGKDQNRNRHIQKTAGTTAHHRFTGPTVPLTTHFLFHRPYVVYQTFIPGPELG